MKDKDRYKIMYEILLGKVVGIVGMDKAIEIAKEINEVIVKAEKE